MNTDKNKFWLVLLYAIVSCGFALLFETIIIEKVPSNSDFGEGLNTNLKIAKFENKTIEVFSGIMITIIGFTLFTTIICSCKTDSKNTISNFGFIKLSGAIINFLCLILSIAITFQVKKEIKKTEESPYESIKKKSVKVIIIEVFAIIFYILDMFLYFYIVSKIYSEQSQNSQHIIGEPDKRYQYNEIKQYIDISIYEALIKGIFDKRANEHLIQIILFYKNQQFDGLCDDDSIKKEIIDIIIFIVAVLHYQNDKLMIILSKDIKNNFSILFEYSLPLILTVIKLKLENGFYKKRYVVVKKIETQFFLSMEREIEKNDKGDITSYKSVFRCRKVSNETIQVLRTNLQSIE